jgi:hypothetical protein
MATAFIAIGAAFSVPVSHASAATSTCVVSDGVGWQNCPS